MFRSILMTTVLVSLCAASSVHACSVPVFRYALEQWRPDAFEVIVFHKGPLTTAERHLAAKIESKDFDAAYTANARIRLVDLDKSPEPELLEQWHMQQTKTLPWMLVRSPAKFGKPLDVVSQKFNQENVTSLLDSPLRKKITDSILKGDSIVWVLLESGDKQKDALAAEIMEGELKRLQGELKLPEIDEQDIQDGILSVDPDALRLRFSMIRVSKDDPRERAFVQMLLTVEPDLREAEFINQPMALPIFGRGRALYALIGKGINSQTLEDACRFLTGACQCTVKAQNPGVDILTTVDWDSLVVATLEQDTILPPLTGLSGFGKPTVENDVVLVDKAEDATLDNPTNNDATNEDSTTQDATADEATTEEAVAVTSTLPDHTGSPTIASGRATPDAPPASMGVGMLSLYVLGGLALLVFGLYALFAPKPS